MRVVQQFTTETSPLSSFQSFLPAETDRNLRFLQTLPLIRLFSQVKRARHVVSTFTRIVPSFFSLFLLLLIVFDIYAKIGVSLFAGKLGLSISNGGFTSGNFDTLGRAMLTLFQLLVGEVGELAQWHVIV